MPAKLYPFIDIAVHERVREHFAHGDAAVLFSPDMSRVLWSNGEGANLFSMASIYDFIDGGPSRQDISFRQLEATARQLVNVGDRRQFLMRVTSGFRTLPVNASVALIDIKPGETAVLFAAPRTGRALSPAAQAAKMISGFDDPDTHMAVLDAEGGVLAASAGFADLAMTPQTCRMLVSAAARAPDWLVKRPVPTGKGNLPAAIGKLSDSPSLHLLFAVETILGNLDSAGDFGDEEAIAATIPDVGPALTDDGAIAAPLMDVAGIESETLAQPEIVVENVDAAPEQDALADAAPASEAMLLENEATAADQDDGAEAVVEELTEQADNTSDQNTDLTVQDENAAQGIASQVPETTQADMFAEENPDRQNDADENGHDVEPFDGEGEGDEVHAIDAGKAWDPALDGADIADLPQTEDVESFAFDEVVQADTPVNDAVSKALDSGENPDAITEEPLQADGTEIQTGPANVLSDDPSIETTNGTVHAAPDAPDGAFVFNPDMRAVRFVWKIDANGRFSEISDEFASAVGPTSAAISGLTFVEIAERYHLDQDNTVGNLLKRRDTWSGKTIFWPVENTGLVAPVDLAALPTYSRDRKFDGFRGFGIVRIADAVEDERRTGLSLGLPAPQAVTETVEVPAEAPSEILTDEPTGEDIQPDAEAVTGVDDQPVDVSAVSSDQNSTGIVEEQAPAANDIEAPSEDETWPVPEIVEDDIADPFADLGKESGALVQDEDPFEDPFQGERPALKLVETPRPTESDKIIPIETRRPAGVESLTRGEQAAFREIARQLGATFGKRTEPVTPSAEAEVPAPVEPVTPLETEDAVSAGDSDIVASAIAAPPTRSGNGLNAEIVDGLPVALLVHAGEDLFHANPEFLSLTGYASIEALHEEGGIDALFAHNEDGLFDLPEGLMMLIRNDGHLIPVRAHLQSIRWDEKSALMMALSTAGQQASGKPSVAAAEEQTATPDAVEEDGAERAALRMEAEELRSILETATDGVVVVGSDGEIRSLNRSASALFNYDDAEVRGKPFATLFAHESQKAVLDYLSGLSGHGVASVLNDGREVIGREATGGFIPLFMTMGRLSSSNGYCAVIRDITQWKRTEEELRNAKRAAETANAHKTDFLARVSHEIRTPLNAIIGFSDMMASEHFGPIGNNRYVEYANDIGRSGRHVLDIVNDLLDISKIEAGEMDLNFSAVELNEAVSEAVSLVQPQANGQRVIIRTSLSTSVPNIVADSRSIKQMALNILSNAIRFTPSGGQIVVSTAYETNGSVILRIRDTGIGMTRGELEQAMKPFRQVTTGARKRGDGTGLGLPLTKAMAEANRAQFSINSAPNEGTLVEISFPSQRVLAD